MGYDHREIGECSKIVEAKKSSSDDMSHNDGSDDGKLSPKRYECSKGHVKSSPHCQSHNSKEKFKCHGDFGNVGDIDYLWEKFPCTFCDAADHCVADCEQHKVMVKRMDQILGTKHEESLPVMKTSFLMGKRNHFCIHCSVNGHQIQKCWKLHSELHPKRDEEVMRSILRKVTGGNMEIDVVPKETFKVKRCRKRTHKSGIGKGWVNYVVQFT